MRLIWSGFLLTGLLMIGTSVFERRQARPEAAEQETSGWVGMSAREDGGGWPSPNSTPTPPAVR
jgi:hypothetical protein